MILKKHTIYTFDSNGRNIYNKSADNSSFYISYSNTPIKIDKNAVEASVSVINASIWNTFFNVVSTNNSFQFKGTTYNLFQPTQYNDVLLNNEVQRINTSLGAGYDIVFTYDEIHQRTSVISATGGQLNFNVPNSIAEVLGWTNTDILTLVANVPQWAPNDSRYNTFQDIYIHSDICQGFNENAEYNSLIGIIPNFVGTGYHINYSPNQLITSDCLYLANSPKYSVRIWITDKNNNPLLLPDKYDYTITIKIEWKTLLKIKDEK